jgi:hypothetical protein
MTSLAICVPTNAPGKRDGTYFLACARRWQARHSGELHKVDTGRSKQDRFRDLCAAIERTQPGIVAYFGHGLRDRLPQCGATLANVHRLAEALRTCGTHPRIALFSCLAADDLAHGRDDAPGGDGGYADSLRDACVKHGAFGVQVDAHVTAGDAVANPHVRRFAGPEDKDHIGGQWLVEPRSKLWRAWDKALEPVSKGGEDYWLKFPTLTTPEIWAHLED